MVNKFGNDFKNNIMWNKEYPFIPYVTNDAGFTIHEGDIVEFYDKCYKQNTVARVTKIYSKDFVWVRYNKKYNGLTSVMQSANFFKPYTHGGKLPPLDDFDNQSVWNWLEDILGMAYRRAYPTELSLENDWHFDEDKFDKKRLEEVELVKAKYYNK